MIHKAIHAGECNITFLTLLVKSQICRKQPGHAIVETQKDRDLAPVKRALATVEILLPRLNQQSQNIVYLSAELNRLCRIRVSTDKSIRDLSPVGGLILPLYSVVAHRNATSRVQSI